MPSLENSIPFNPTIPTSSRSINLTGQTYGKLTVFSIWAVAGEKPTTTYWLCRCKCEQWITIRTGQLRNTPNIGCGCGKGKRKSSIPYADRIIERNTFYSAKNRCRNPSNAQYNRYGGRGIEFRFDNFEEFFEHLGERPSIDHSLDRINNDGHYEKGNVRWATRKQQMNNRSVNRLITVSGITKTVAEWEQSGGFKDNVIRERLSHGWCNPCSVGNPLGVGCPHRPGKSHTANAFK